MKTKIQILFLMMLALCCAAANIDNQTINGFPLILPEPKSCVQTTDALALPKAITVTGPKEINMKALDRTFQQKGITLKAGAKGLIRFELAKGNRPASPEEYTLEISKKGILIQAHAKEGLFCGLQTLRWIVRNTNGTTLKGCKINDWPDLPRRGVFLEVHHLRPEWVDKFCNAIDIYAQLKYNLLIVDFSANFPLKGNPLSKHEHTLTVENIKKIKQTCVENGIELQPSLQIVTHAWWMSFHPEFDEKYSEGKPRTAWLSSYCLSRPEPEALVMQYLNEAIDLLQPKYFSLAMDEIYCCPFQQCPKCKGKDPVKLFGEHAKRVMDLLYSRGVTPNISYDQFELDSPTCPRSPICAAIKMFDRRTIIQIWDYHVNPNPNIDDYFRTLGFTNFNNMSYSMDLANVWTLPMASKQKGTQGCILSTWHAFSATIEHTVRADNFAGIVLGATDTWNVGHRLLAKRSYDPIAVLKKMRHPALIKFQGETGTPIPLNKSLNRRFGKDILLPVLSAKKIAALKADLAARPERFHLVTDGDAYFGTALTGGAADGFTASPVVIPVNRKVGGLSFLLASAPFNDYLVSNRNVLPEIASLEIQYENHDPVKVPLLNRRHIAPWSAEYGGYEARVVNHGLDDRNISYNFFATDWKNPLPDCTIKSITFTSGKKETQAPVLFAISAFQAKEGGIAPFSDKAIAKAIPAAPACPAPELTPLLDLEQNGLKGIRHAGDLPDRFAGRIRYEVTTDKATGEKMITAFVPGINQKRGTWARVTVDIPLPNVAKEQLQTFHLEYRFSQPNAVWYAGLYACSKDGACNVNWGINSKVCMNQDFYTFNVPFQALHGKEKGGLHFERTPLHLRLSFFVDNKEPMTIDIKNPAISSQLLPGISGARPTNQKDASK